MGLKTTTSTKQIACKKQSHDRKKSAAKYEAVWQSKAKRSCDSLLEEEVDPAVEAHMSLSVWEPLPLHSQDVFEEDVNPIEETHMALSSASSQNLQPIPLEHHDISWECNYDDKAWEHLFQLARSDSSS